MNGAKIKIDIEHLRGWVGRTETLDDVVSATPPRALAATLDHEDSAWPEGRELPPFWHWLYFLPLHRQSQLGKDGHAERGGFLPPVALPRRMWAGSRVQFLAPLRLGDAIRRCSTIEDVRLKEGRTGPLVFVTARHEIAAAGVPSVIERQDIVYRNAPSPSELPPTPVVAPAEAGWSRRIDPDPVLLFRYSALTFNGHRIHYDQPFTTQDEGYPGLVVHGPLIATLLLDLVARERPRAIVKAFSFRAVRPLFDTAPFHVCGSPEGDGSVTLWARSPEGYVAMQAEATFS
jgi:3-methylfumaryl-CoA hydratase